MHAGELLRAARIERGLGQAELARRAATTQTYVSRVERGVVAPSMKTLQRLLHAMGLQLRSEVEELPSGNVPAAQLRHDFQTSTVRERLDEAMGLSEFLTGVAASAGGARESDAAR